MFVYWLESLVCKDVNQETLLSNFPPNRHSDYAEDIKKCGIIKTPSNPQNFYIFASVVSKQSEVLLAETISPMCMPLWLITSLVLNSHNLLYY